MSSGIRSGARLLIGVLAAAVCVWLAFRHVEWETTATIVRSANPAWIGVALVVLAVDYLCRVLRWRIMLAALTPVSLTTAAGALLSGMALNNVLPFRAGDVMRTAGFRRQLGLPVSAVLGTMVLERLLDLATVILMFGGGMLFLSPDGLPAGLLHGVSAAAVTTAVLLFALLSAPDRLSALVHVSGAAAERRGWAVGARLASWTAGFFGTLTPLRRRSIMLPLLLLSCAVWLLEGSVFAAVALAVGVGGPLISSWFAMATGTLGTLLPGTPGYVGTFDYFATLGFTAFGVAAEQALAATLLVHAVLWAPITLIGLGWLVVMKARPAATIEAATPAEATP